MTDSIAIQEKARELSCIAYDLRIDTIRMLANAQAGHPGSTLSAAEILSVLFFDELRISPERAYAAGRDRFIASKGHVAPMVYAALCKRGFFDSCLINSFRSPDSPLQAYPDMRKKLPGLELSSVSLGNGLSIGLGMALALRREHASSQVFVLMGDGELQEGIVWEAGMAASQYKCSNLIGIIDRNRLQLSAHVSDIVEIEPLAKKWRAFGWQTVVVDGHDVVQLSRAFDSARKADEPCMIIANTIKGKGVSFMEDRPEWHNKAIGIAEAHQALEELVAGRFRL